MSEIVFITGAPSGIGQTLAHQYVVQDAMIGLAAWHADVLHESVQTLPAGIQSRCHCYVADVRSAESMRDVANAFIIAVGLPDVVTANAGISVGTDLCEPGDLKAFTVVMGTNWISVLNTFQPFVGPILAHARPGQPGGALVGTANMAGVRGLPGAAAYSASKSAVTKLMENLRVKFGPPGLCVVAIALGYIRTPMTGHDPYPMPFPVSVDRLALKAVNAIHRGVRFTVLPWSMGMVAELLHVLLRGLCDFVFARVGRKLRSPEISS